MQYRLPENHGLSQTIVDELVHFDDGNPSLTDAQYKALEAGVGRGKSALVVSPTSTGKTQIALWAISKGIEERCTTVYLVTHRALAKQKFEEFKLILLDNFLDSSRTSIVLATGDTVENVDGDLPANPLDASLLVATYEKYLALLSASGIPTDMRSTVVVCDEIQLIGDKYRGQNVEILLTLIRNAGWRQFVGLSAVLKAKDAHDIGHWLEVDTVIDHTREKQLVYECWSTNTIHTVNTEFPETIDKIQIPHGVECDTLSILNYLLHIEPPALPAIVFCMRKIDTYELANNFIEQYLESKEVQLSLAFEDLPDTEANSLLSRSFANRIAIHSADLTDEERQVVEKHLFEGKLDVVFATSTLAAGVNYPLGSAIFSKWKRWNFNRRQHVPIEVDEFHNMAGRVGRMGFDHEKGRVILIAESQYDLRDANHYLDLQQLPSLEGRVKPESFSQLTLQLVASGICNNRDSVEQLICSTFSAIREEDENIKNFQSWPDLIQNAITNLVEEGFLLETDAGMITATPVGKAIGNSGMLPDTGSFMLKYIAEKLDSLLGLLPQANSKGNISKLAFLLFCACFSSPEFRPNSGKQPTRYLPYPLDRQALFDADVYREDLPEPVWQADFAPINGAKLCLDWIDGAKLRDLERSLPNLSAGMIREMHRNLVWSLQGMASIITAASDPRIPPGLLPKAVKAHSIRPDYLRKLPRVIRRLSYRLSDGLPDDVLWMTSLNRSDSEFSLTKDEIISLRQQDYNTPEKIMLGTVEADNVRRKAFAKAKPSPKTKSNLLRDICRTWKIDQRKSTATKQYKRAKNCSHKGLVKEFYEKRGTEFETVFENILTYLDISFEKLDDRTKVGAPDYLLQLKECPPIVIELKSKMGDKLVDYNSAVKVLAASEVHGYKEAFCVTLCHPGVDPSVPMVVSSCGRLSVVESTDIGEALLRLCENSIDQIQLWNWFASPGQALIADLPFRSYF